MRLAEDLTRAIKTQDVELSHFDRGCAKTRAFNLRVESSSQFGQSENQKCWRRLSEEGNRENSSTLSWLAHVFTQAGPVTDLQHRGSTAAHLSGRPARRRPST